VAVTGRDEPLAELSSMAAPVVNALTGGEESGGDDGVPRGDSDSERASGDAIGCAPLSPGGTDPEPLPMPDAAKSVDIVSSDITSSETKSSDIAFDDIAFDDSAFDDSAFDDIAAEDIAAEDIAAEGFVPEDIASGGTEPGAEREPLDAP
jgi:hypothetical protein